MIKNNIERNKQMIRTFDIYGLDSQNDPWKSLLSEFQALSNMMSKTFNDDFKNRGLKDVITKPHNLLTNKDEKGNVVSYSLEVVYTPFKKEDVKVQVLNNILTVACGKENKVKDPNMIYCGISNQSYTFSLPLDKCVDTAEITAKAEDGILTITLPLKKPDLPEEPEPLKITVQ